MTRPTGYPEWASAPTAGDVVDPGATRKASGWTTVAGVPEKPSYKTFNWWQQAVSQWVEYFDSVVALSTLTIATGSITPTGQGHLIDTEASAANDDLTNIVTTNLPEGKFLLVRAANDARTVVLKHAAGGAGQIHLADNSDLSLDSINAWAMLIRVGADWYEMFRSVGPADILPDADSTRDLGSSTKQWAQGWIESLYSNALDTIAASGTLNIGDTNASTINIGRTGATVNILGALLAILSTQTTITDLLITLNKGGAAASGGGSGFEIEENNIITAYKKVSSDRLAFDTKTPASAGVQRKRTAINSGTVEGEIVLTPTIGSFTLDSTENMLHGGNLTISSGHTWNVAGNLTCIGTLTVDGTLTTTGTTRVLA